MNKPITFYATEEDQRAIETIQELKPHWTNLNFILREGLYTLLESLKATAPQTSSGIRYIRES